MSNKTPANMSLCSFSSLLSLIAIIIIVNCMLFLVLALKSIHVHWEPNNDIHDYMFDVCATTQKSQLVHTIVLHVHTQLITCTSSKWIPVG